MKFYLPYEVLKEICLCIADKLKDKDLDCIVAVSRGGLTPAHIIAKALRLPCEFYIPARSIITIPKAYVDVAFVEDLVAEGRTYIGLKEFMALHYSHVMYTYIPIVVDAGYLEEFPIYGFRTQHWAVFPYEENEKTIEGDRGLFRIGDDQYGK